MYTINLHVMHERHKMNSFITKILNCAQNYAYDLSIPSSHEEEDTNTCEILYYVNHLKT